MYKTMTRWFSLWMVPVLLTCLTSCSTKSVPPTKADIQEKFDSCYGYIDLVVKYMISLPYEYAFIDDVDGRYFADYKWHNINDSRILSAIEHLWDCEISNILKDTKRNAISIEMWCSDREIDCGAVYAISTDDKPSVQYLTQLEPLDVELWYYYVTNYNDWRKLN